MRPKGFAEEALSDRKYCSAWFEGQRETFMFLDDDTIALAGRERLAAAIATDCRTSVAFLVVQPKMECFADFLPQAPTPQQSL
jgi:hypothetical protein